MERSKELPRAFGERKKFGVSALQASLPNIFLVGRESHLNIELHKYNSTANFCE